MRFYLLIFLFSIPALLSASYPDSVKIVKKQLNTARQLILSETAENIEKAEILIADGLDFFRQHDDLYHWIQTQSTIGWVWQFEKKNPDHFKALNIFENCLNNNWRVPHADVPKEFKKKAYLLSQIGYAHKKTTGDLISIRDHYLWASKIYVDTLGIEDIYVAKYFYHELANAYTNLKDYDNAEFYLSKIKAISWKNSEWKRWASACRDLGSMYDNKNNYPAAIASIEEALQLKDSLSPLFGVELLLDMGLFLYDADDFGKALEYTVQAENSIKSLEEKDRKDLLYDLHINYGKIYKGLKNFRRSEFHYAQAIALYPDPSRRSKAFMHLNIGTMYTEWGKPDEALKEFKNCLVNLLPGFKKVEKDFILPESNALTAERLLIYVFDKMAENFILQHQAIALPEKVQLAQQCYELASKVETLMLQEYFLEGSSLAVQSDQRRYKEHAMAFIHSNWVNEKSAEQEAFIFKMSERSRAMLLLNNYQLSTNLKNNTPENDALLEQRKQLKKEISASEEKIYALKKEPDFEQITLDALTLKLMRKYESLAILTKKVLSHSTSNIASQYGTVSKNQEVQASLSPDQMLLEYFVGEKHLFIIGMTKDDFHFWKKELPENFEGTIKDFIGSIKNDKSLEHPKTVFANASFQLYQWLMKEAMDWKPEIVDRLLIVPDGLLNYVPFELLIDKTPKEDFAYREVDYYLLANNSFSYAPSASLYVLQSKKEQKRAEKLFAGFAPKYQSNEIAIADTIGPEKEPLAALVRAGEYELKGALEEVIDATALYNGDQYIDRNASEAMFKKAAKNYRILLLSMHSLVNTSNPKFSTLIFTKDGSDNEDDDQLYALELANIPLQAELIVLSACNTGFGELQSGEGVMSFSRAFFSTGVPSTLMTLWKVPDHSSSKIVRSFFKNLKDGLPKDKALQQAKIAYLKSDLEFGEDKPVFWAGFIAAGNVAPMDINLTNSFRYWWALAGMLLFVSFFFVRHRLRTT